MENLGLLTASGRHEVHIHHLPRALPHLRVRDHAPPLRAPRAPLEGRLALELLEGS